MALNFGSFLAGFAKQGTADFEKKEQEVSALVSKSFDKWLIEGPAAHKAQKARKKELRRKAKILSSYNLSNDKIGVILEQGRADEVISYLAKVNSYTGKVRDAYLKPLGGKLENIVQFAEGYEETGMTIDQIVEKVGGKISGGMNLSDAFADIGQKKGSTLANLLTPNESNIVSKRKKMYESIYGKGAIESALAGATGTVDAEGMPTNLNPYTGLSTSDVTFNMPDVEESKRLEKLFTETTAFNTRGQVERNALNYAATKFEGGETIIDRTTGLATGLFVPPKLQEKHKNITSSKIMSLITNRLNEIGKNPEFRNQTTGKFSDEAFSMLQKDIDDYFTINMQTKTDQTIEQKVNRMSSDMAKNQLGVLEDKVRNGLVGSTDTGSITLDDWEEEYGRLLVKLGRAINLDSGKNMAFKKFKSLSGKKNNNQEEPNPNRLPDIFQGFGDPDCDPSTYRGG